MPRLRVTVLYGGRSGEHEVSLQSAESVIAALDPEKYEVQRVLITREGSWEPRPIVPDPSANPGIDVVFPMLHGTFGEDGTVQGLLELAALPYVGAGVLASSVSMDKDVMKRLCLERGLPVVDHVVVKRGHFHSPRKGFSPDDICARFGYPVFVKPANLGSSVGITKAKSCEELRAALELAGEYDRKILVERAIEGREFECSVLGNDGPVAAIPCEIVPSREFYDYEDKYLLNQAQTIVPANLPEKQIREIQRLAVACYQAVECEGMARVDFLLETSTQKIYINEINTVPGFTSISMFARMWEAAGVAYPQLLDRLIELAFERHRERQATRYAR